MLKIKMSLSNDEYKGLEEMWESENVYDRGRQNLPNIPSAVQQQSDEHIFYDSGFSLKVIQNSDLEYDLKNNLGFTKTGMNYNNYLLRNKIFYLIFLKLKLFLED